LEGKKEFDIRKLHTFSLVEPQRKLMPSLDPKVNEMAYQQKMNMIY